MPVIPITKVVDKKRIIEKKGSFKEGISISLHRFRPNFSGFHMGRPFLTSRQHG
jgi:hypothetical protein